MKSKITMGLPAALLIAGSALAAPATKAPVPPAKAAVKAPAKAAAKAQPKVKLPKGVVAMVGSTPIYEKDILERMWREAGPDVTARAANQMIVELEARKRHISVKPAQVQKELDTEKQSFMSQPGRKASDWETIVSRYGKSGMLQDVKIRLLAKQIGEDEAKKVKLTPAEIKDAEDQVEKESHQVHAKHILVGMGENFGNRSDADAQKRIQEVQDKLKAGSKWDDLAKEYSDDRSNKDRGGDLGFFPRGAMVKAFEDAAFSMKPGDITPAPVKSEYGYHLIQVLEVKNDAVTAAAKKAATDKALENKKNQVANTGVWFNQVRGNYKIQTEMPYER